jgi:nucleoside-diphosphate-sugar epimerase
MASKGSILVIGSSGQIGAELVERLRTLYGRDQVIASDLKDLDKDQLKDAAPYEVLNVLNAKRLFEVVRKYDVRQVYLLAALLSATAERNPAFAWDLNMNGLFNVLDLAKEGHLDKVYWPSSIAVFGPTTPSDQTPQYTVMEPNTVYGISKQAGERWCEYYHAKYGVDVRSLRYPGLIGWKTAPGGGTTDYAVHIYHAAIQHGSYECFLRKDTVLPMMYMPDAIKATVDLMEAPANLISIRSSYNLAAMSFSPLDIAESIREYYPNFTLTYQPDFRQAIADSWPRSINDAEARHHWNWKPDFDLRAMTKDMITHLRAQYEG